MRYTFLNIWSDIWLLKRTSLWPIMLLCVWMVIFGLLLRASVLLFGDAEVQPGDRVTESVLLVIGLAVCTWLLFAGRMAERRADKDAIRRRLFPTETATDS